MHINHTRERLAKGETVFGTMLQTYRSPEIARTFAAAGFDYVFIDMEHSAYDLETVQDMIQASLSAGITPMVRPCELLYSLIARLLDAGAQGIILPRIDGAKELEEALSWLRYPPGGKRGFGVNASMIGYEVHTMPQIMEHMNRNTVSVVQFETLAAFACADELLSLPGVDVAMVGPADLSVALGIPGDFENPKLVSTVERLIEQCRQHNVAPGIQTRTVAMAKTWTARGMRYVGSSAEHAMLLEKARENLTQLKSASAVHHA
jgi:2-dehydro-3-deoxyglucarate aldolase/4-hydroxy-2-oxoheptanedioate aldolase